MGKWGPTACCRDSPYSVGNWGPTARQKKNRPSEARAAVSCADIAKDANKGTCAQLFYLSPERSEGGTPERSEGRDENGRSEARPTSRRSTGAPRRRGARAPLAGRARGDRARRPDRSRRRQADEGATRPRGRALGGQGGDERSEEGAKRQSRKRAGGRGEWGRSPPRGRPTRASDEWPPLGGPRSEPKHRASRKQERPAGATALPSREGGQREAGPDPRLGV